MSISSTVKKIMPYIKTTSGYVLHRLSSQAVEMDDGTTLEEKVTALNNLISQKVDTSTVVNNLLTTEAGFVLDARQGKTLNDSISELSSNKVSGFGDMETVSNPYTPDVDGLIRIYFSPSGNTNATVYATQNGTSHFSATSSGGANIAQFFPALAGHTYQGQASQPGTIQLAFMPLRTGELFPPSF